MKKKETQLKSTVSEKIFYALGDVGGGVMWMFASAFLTMYYTDSVGLSAAFAGTMMLICRVFDGASDIIMGTIIDKTRTRWGKARPWLLFSSIPLALTFISVFNVPSDLGETGKNIYAFVTYFLLSVVCYTANNLAYHSLLPRFSLTSTDRATVSSVRSIFTIVAVLTMNIVSPILLIMYGGMDKQRSWTFVAIIYGLISVIALFITFFGVKEKVPLDDRTDGEQVTKVPMKIAIRSLLSKRYFYIALFIFLANAVSTGAQGINLYYARDVLGDVKIYGLMSIVALIPMIICAPIAPILFKKFGKRNTMLGGLILSVGALSLLITNPRSVPMFLILTAVRGIGVSPLNVGSYTLAGDIVDYTDMNTGIRPEGICTAANSMGMKLGTGFGAAMLGWMLAWGKYDASLSVQPESAINAMIVVAVIVPLVLYVIAFILLMVWDLDKYQPEVQEYLKKHIGATNNS